MKVVAINGSPRKKGNTHNSLRRILGSLEKNGIETEFIQLGGVAAGGCTACYKCFDAKDGACHGRKDDINSMITAIMSADAVLLGSPVYFGSVTAEMKALIDRAGLVSRANGHLLSRKVGAAVVSVRRQGGLATFNQINQFFLINNMVVPGAGYWNIAMGREPGDALNDEEGMKTMDELADNIVWLLDRLAG